MREGGREGRREGGRKGRREGGDEGGMVGEWREERGRREGGREGGREEGRPKMNNHGRAKVDHVDQQQQVYETRQSYGSTTSVSTESNQLSPQTTINYCLCRPTSRLGGCCCGAQVRRFVG